MVITFEDICRLEVILLKVNNVELLNKIIEIKDYMHFYKCKELEFDVDWRKRQKEELK